MAIDGFLTRSVRDSAALLDACAGPDLGAPYVAPPLREGYRAAMDRAPGKLRVAVCDMTLTGEAIHPDCAAAVQDTAALLAEMGHHVEPALPRADTLGMMRAWTIIVGCGAALGVHKTLKALGRDLAPDDVEGVTRGALRFAENYQGEDYLDCVGKIHAYGREMAVFLRDYDVFLTATLAEPPAKVGRFSHATEDYEAFRTGPDGIFAYSPFCAAFNASGQPAVSVPLHWNAEGLPIGVHLAAQFGEDELLMSLCAELERARPWFDRRPAMSA